MRKFTLNTIFLLTSLIFTSTTLSSQSYNYEDQWYRESLIPGLSKTIRTETQNFIVFYSDGELKYDSTLVNDNWEKIKTFSLDFAYFMKNEPDEMKLMIFEVCSEFMEEFFDGMTDDHIRFNLSVDYEYVPNFSIDNSSPNDYRLYLTISAWASY